MAELSTVARPYAEALFSVARQGDLVAWSSLVSELASVAAHPSVMAVIADPKLSSDQVYALFTGVVKAPLPTEAQNFLRTLVENDRLQLLPEVGRQFAHLKNLRDGVADAEIVSAFALADAQLADLVAALEKKFGVKLRPQVIVDASLIGGVRVTVGDETLDTSVRARLDAMRSVLTA